MSTTAGPNNQKFRFIRVNAFRGLLVDEFTWADAHDYHRTQMRFHQLAMHGTGIVQGLDVLASNPADINVVVRPGLAIDPEGRMLFLAEQQVVAVPAVNSLNTVYVSLEFSERPAQIQNVTEGGEAMPTRILEECQVKVALEQVTTGVELARITLEPNANAIRNANNSRQPTNNEIDLTGRTLVADRASGGSSGAKQTRASVTVGIVRYGQAGNTDWKRHSEGVRRLLRDISRSTNLDGNLIDGVAPLDETVMRSCKFLYMTGRGAFRFTPEEEQALRRHLDRGGILWCEPCRNGLPNGAPDDFSRSVMELAQHLGRQAIQPRAGHPLLTTYYLFATPPVALDPQGVIVESNRMIIATGDYGCLWEGKGQERGEPPFREIIRSAQEFGTNAVMYAAGQTA